MLTAQGCLQTTGESVLKSSLIIAVRNMLRHETYSFISLAGPAIEALQLRSTDADFFEFFDYTLLRGDSARTAD